MSTLGVTKDFPTVGEVPNIDLFPAPLARETWVDTIVRIWAPILGCDPVALSKLLDMALIVANAHNELLTREQAMDAIRAMMGTRK
jgi:hypothetical protein